MKSKILILIGFIFILISFSLIIYNKYEDKKAGKKAKETVDKIEEKLSTIKDEKIDEIKIINIDGYDYIGKINIPVLNLELPIMSDWDYKKMKISPCRYYGSFITNDLVICAHAYQNFFANIKTLKQKDKLILTDMLNNEYIYEVELVEVLSSYEIKEMIESEFDLTLFTCTDDNQNRITVRLNRI